MLAELLVRLFLLLKRLGYLVDHLFLFVFIIGEPYLGHVGQIGDYCFFALTELQKLSIV